VPSAGGFTGSELDPWLFAVEGGFVFAGIPLQQY
jgi:hypothetical protein